MNTILNLLTLGTALGATLASAVPADDYINFIRQIEKSSGVEWDVSVPPNGTALSPTGVTLEGALFELWTVHDTTADDYLLDEKFVSAYLPASLIQIETGDPYTAVARTRIDQPFTVRIDVRGLLFSDNMVNAMIEAPADGAGPDQEILDEETQAALDDANEEKAEAEAKIAQGEVDHDIEVAEVETKYAETMAAAQLVYDTKTAEEEANYAEAIANAQQAHADEYTKAAEDLAEDLIKADEEDDPIKRQEKIDEAHAAAAKIRTEADEALAEDTAKAEEERTDKLAGLAEDLVKATTEAEEKRTEDTAKAAEELAEVVAKNLEAIEGIDTEFATKYGDDALLTGAGDETRELDEDASQVFFTHQAFNYPDGAHSLDGIAAIGKSIQESFITQNGLIVFNYATTNLDAPDLTTASGEEIFTVTSMAGYQIAETTLDSKRVQIWPIAQASMTGFDPSIRYDHVPPVSIDLQDLYPASATYLRVYFGPPSANPVDPKLIPDSYVLIDDSTPQQRDMRIKNLDGFLDEDGTYTMEIIHETPFGTDLLAQGSIQVDRTISMKGSIISK